ncbi:hypothetical protein RclHR1_09320004 [Rhizophagus clarus]|uniref:Uncharacterized protein n=1 Tax=Rhizophagus clarus TaxID=94130 RepID=A0A2Z6SA39_9GLOM|nr:hypothetical protein RclHR1_09320004 [Rhizophagus clarus]GES72503.1 hypothetical protein RCL_jg25244.t1 [Rhizophagus clarus]
MSLRGQPEVTYDGNGAMVEYYDDPFIAPPVPPSLHNRLTRLIEAVLLTFEAIRKYIATYIQEPWADVGKKLKSRNLYWVIE